MWINIRVVGRESTKPGVKRPVKYLELCFLKIIFDLLPIMYQVLAGKYLSHIIYRKTEAQKEYPRHFPRAIPLEIVFSSFKLISVKHQKAVQFSYTISYCFQYTSQFHFISVFNSAKYLLSTSYSPGTILGSEYKNNGQNIHGHWQQVKGEDRH